MSLLDDPKTSTLPKLVQRNAVQDPKGAGIREKSRGVWQTYDWVAYRDTVRDFALGLASLGFQRGDKLSVVGDNRPQLYFAQLSAQALGGVSVPVYQDSIASELEELAFEAGKAGEQTVTIDAAYVDGRLEVLAQREDLARYVL